MDGTSADESAHHCCHCIAKTMRHPNARNSPPLLTSKTCTDWRFTSLRAPKMVNVPSVPAFLSNTAKCHRFALKVPGFVFGKRRTLQKCVLCFRGCSVCFWNAAVVAHRGLRFFVGRESTFEDL